MRPQIAMPDNVAPLGASNICNLGDLIGFRMVGVVRIELPATAMSMQRFKCEFVNKINPLWID